MEDINPIKQKLQNYRPGEKLERAEGRDYFADINITSLAVQRDQEFLCLGPQSEFCFSTAELSLFLKFGELNSSIRGIFLSG